MPRLSLWNPKKGNDYKFIDKNVKSHFDHGGTSLLIHKYIGSQDKTAADYDPASPAIQDLPLPVNDCGAASPLPCSLMIPINSLVLSSCSFNISIALFVYYKYM